MFLDDRDREHFLELVEQVARRYKRLITPYVLMTNHFHFIIEKLLNASYASWFNKRHGRIHSLFGERYKAILIEKQAYLQRVVRYVVL
ncbi:MAG TPA: addiction module toxin RelE, partial [Thermoanaerobaculia bacterium]|nr:addiction module toxin RelE [Thermoanaerobaculia bacterium]